MGYDSLVCDSKVVIGDMAVMSGWVLNYPGECGIIGDTVIMILNIKDYLT